jgi:hypothetical protein
LDIPIDGDVFALPRDLDDDGDRDLFMVSVTTRIVALRATGDGFEIEAVDLGPGLDGITAIFPHPSDPSIVVAMEGTHVSWIDIDSSTMANSGDCPDLLASPGLSYSPPRPIDVDDDGLPDVVVSLSDGFGIGIVSLDPTEICSIEITPLSPTPSWILGQTPESLGNNLWFGQGFSVSDGQGITDGSIVASALPLGPILDRASFGDVDGDGEPEMVGGDGTLLYVYKISGTTWSSSQTEGDGQVGGAVELADVDCDGDLDFLAEYQFWENNGAGAFTLTQDFSGSPGLVLREDVTSDGVADFIRLTTTTLHVIEGVAP